LNVPTIDFNPFSVLTTGRTSRLDRDDFTMADPFGVRVGVLAARNVVIKHMRA
jgi:hypothetical protein